MALQVGMVLMLSGCVTKEKFLLGRTLQEMERILGFHPGRLREGAAVAVLQRLPALHEFELAGYSNVATHRHATPQGLDIARLKELAQQAWSMNPPERLVKVLPALRHDPSMSPDVQYPPGLGAPQWNLSVAVQSQVVALITSYPAGKFLAASARTD